MARPNYTFAKRQKEIERKKKKEEKRKRKMEKGNTTEGENIDQAKDEGAGI